MSKITPAAERSRQADEADRDLAAARETDALVGIPLEEVVRWVDSWDTPAELPMPKARPLR